MPKSSERWAQVYFCDYEDAEYKLPYMVIETNTGEPLFALLDTGATRSLITKSAVSRLKLEVVERGEMEVIGIHGPEVVTSEVVILRLRSHTEQIWSIKISTHSDFPIKFRAPQFPKEDVEYLKRYGISAEQMMLMKQHNGKQVDMIIGNEIISKIAPDIIRLTLPSRRIVEKTPLGNVTYPSPSPNTFTNSYSSVETDLSDYKTPVFIQVLVATTTAETSNEKLSKKITELFELDNIGIVPPQIVAEQQASDNYFVKRAKEEAIFVDGKVQVSLPFNGRECELTDNFPMAAKRLNSLMITLKRDKKLLYEYDKIIQQQLRAGIIEKVETIQTKNKVYYIPHRHVLKDSATTSLRIVNDAGSKMRGKIPLNGCLHSGPSILQEIPGILIRVRLKRFLLLGDLEKAFHTVTVRPEHRDVARFLWPKDIEGEPSGENLETYRYTVLAFGLTCSPFLLIVTILMWLERNPTPIKQQILKNLYVDNLAFTTNDEKKLKWYKEEAKEFFAKASMNLREFGSNSSWLNALIPDEDFIKTEEIKLLGHIWNRVSDDITHKIPTPPENIPTKRELLSFYAQNYDPTGILSPTVIQLKELFQETCTVSSNWNSPIPEELHPKWIAIKESFNQPSFKQPRQLITNYDYESVQLHIFSDASEKHFAAAAYLHFRYANDKSVTRLIMSKTRIKSKNVDWSIPRLELLGIEIAVNMAINLTKELEEENISQVKFFSDSTIALYWVLKKERLCPFVDSRVDKIHQNITLLKNRGLKPTFYHCQTEDNPADLPTRGTTIDKLAENEIWFHGPKFLETPEKQWPVKIEGTISYPDQYRNIIVKEVESSKSKNKQKVVACISDSSQSDYESVVPYSYTFSFQKLIGVMNAIGIMAVRRLKKRKWNSRWLREMAKCKDDTIAQRQLTKRFIIKDHYQDSENRWGTTLPKDIPTYTGKDGLVHFNRHLDSSTLADETKQPIVLVKEHPITKMIVMELHQKQNHAHTSHLVSLFRRNYWIKGLQNLARKTVKQCVKCRKVLGKPFQYPFSMSLPKYRTRYESPFAHVGLDYFGPIKYRTVRNNTEKAWVLLVTCLITRSVHLEVVLDCSTAQYLMALQRTFARRGTPKSIYCDNAATFKLGNKMINVDIKSFHESSQTLTAYLAINEIKVTYITPLAPWQGGVYERIVGLIKTQLYKTVSPLTLSFIELVTVLTQIEGTVNSRPLTENTDENDPNLALRPTDFLIPEARLLIPVSDIPVEGKIRAGDTEGVTRLMMSQLHETFHKLWQDWQLQYLVNLKQSKASQKRSAASSPKVGQVVLVHEDMLPRQKWALARIVELKVSADGEIRTAKISLRNKVLERPVNQLIPLEVEEDPEPEIETSEDPQTQEQVPSSEPGDDPEVEATPPSGPPRSESECENRTRPKLARQAKQPIDYVAMNNGTRSRGGQCSGNSH